MLSEERLEKVLELINQRNCISNRELVEALNTSESTIRRDVTLLAEEGKIIRIHGGAKSLTFDNEDSAMAIRRSMNNESKQKIAAYAASLIEESDIVFIDAGSTTEYLIDHIPVTGAIFVTNAASHGIKLASRGLRTYIIGGEIKAVTEIVTGSEAMLNLEKYNFTKGFFGANGVSTERGYTTPEIREADIKRFAMSRCREKYVLADSSKLGKVTNITFSPIENAKIITEKATGEYKKYSITVK